jgi:hypothetical protein
MPDNTVEARVLGWQSVGAQRYILLAYTTSQTDGLSYCIEKSGADLDDMCEEGGNRAITKVRSNRTVPPLQ